MKQSWRVIKISFALFSAVFFSACAPEVRYIKVPCEAEKPARPHSADFASEFDYLKAIFNYTFALEKRAKVCD